MSPDQERIAYRPSCGSEGADFMQRWCGKCALDRAFQQGEGDSCDIAAATMAFDITDPEYPDEWRKDGPAGARCTAFQAIDSMVIPLDPSAVVRPLL